MKVLVGSFQCESNTFCRTRAKLKDFMIESGEEAVTRLAASKIFLDHGYEVIPSVFASALPSGEVSLEAFETIKGQILEVVRKHPNLDAIYLYLHGAMCVETIGSGEENLILAVRKIVGPNLPIGVALDYHANNTEAFTRNIQVISGFRTTPHTDHDETEIRVAKGLCRCLEEGVFPHMVMFRVPILAADAGTTNKAPMKDLQNRLYKLDQNPDIISASVFNGQAWVDQEYVGATVVISYISGRESALRMAREMAQYYWNGRENIKFDVPSMEIDKALEAACASEKTPVFITDSGDNTTAGAEGESTVSLKTVMDKKCKNLLVCGVTDKELTLRLINSPEGCQIEEVVGAAGKDAFIVPVPISGKLAYKGKVIGWAGEDAGRSVLIHLSTGSDLIVTDVRAAFISPKHFKAAGVNPDDYQAVIVKMGYLFPKLEPIAASSIFALTPGTSTNVFSMLDYHKISRPIYPIDTDFDYIAQPLLL